MNLFIFIFPINLKSESIDDHCHCVNAQQQSFEYLDDIDKSENSKITQPVFAPTKEILIQERPENIWNIVNKGYRIPDPKKKWAKKVVFYCSSYPNSQPIVFPSLGTRSLKNSPHCSNTSTCLKLSDKNLMMLKP